MLTQLDSENNDYNLTTAQTILTHTPSTAHNMLCRVWAKAGDGVKNLAGSGLLTLTITVDGGALHPGPEIVAIGAGSVVINPEFSFLVPANTQVIATLLSSNGSDTDVDVTAKLYDSNDTELHLMKADAVNKKTHTIATGVDVVYDDDNSTPLKTLTPSVASGVITRMPS